MEDHPYLEKSGGIYCPNCRALIELFGHNPKWTQEDIDRMKAKGEEWYKYFNETQEPTKE